MPKEIDPKEAGREAAMRWMRSPMPMVTVLKTLDVTKLRRVCRRKKLRFNAALCYCIGKAAAADPRFTVVPVGEKLVKYDGVAVDIVGQDKKGDPCTFSVAYREDFADFYADYLASAEKILATGEPIDLSDEYAIIGCSALPAFDLDGIINQYSGIYKNPFLGWGGYRKKFFRVKQPISFQFHHTQMDGLAAAQFLARLQTALNEFRG